MEADADRSLWLGIDLGTTSVKVVLINNSGDVVESSSCATLAEVESDMKSCGVEQNPQKILATVHNLALPLVAQHLNKIKGIGVTGQMHGVVMWRQTLNDCGSNERLDKLDDVCCSNLFTWQDQRCTAEFLASLPRPCDAYQPLSTGFGCVTMLWLSTFQPDFYTHGQFTCCGTIMDLLVAMLCGLDHAVTSDQLAASMGYFNRDTVSWDSVLYETNNFPSHFLPKIVPSGTCVGQLSASLEGWPHGVPVYVGLGDCQCAMYASLHQSTDAAINISTSIQLGFAIPAHEVSRVRKESPPSITFFPYFGDRVLALFAGLNGGNAISFFVESLAKWISDLGFCENVDVPSLLNQLQKLAEVSSEEPSASHLEVRPVFFGERHNTNLSGHISGIHSDNFKNIGAVFRSVCEGVVDHLHDMIPSKYLLSHGIDHLLVSGSVGTNNAVVRQRLLELFAGESDLSVTFDVEDKSAVASAVGAARVARDCVQDFNK